MTFTFDDRATYIEKEWGSLKGKTIEIVRPLTKAECDSMYWHYDGMVDALVVIFTDGTGFIPMCDPEGNGAGFLELVETSAVKN